MPATMVVQLSDSHLFADKQGCLKEVNTFDSLRKVLSDAEVRYPQASAYLFTGDLSQDGSAESYENLKELIGGLVARPCFVIAGNHDHVVNMQHCLVSDYIKFESFVDFANWRILFVNTQVVNEEHGFISRVEMERLKSNVSKTQNHLICIHHPPIILNGFIDRSRLQNSDEFFDTLRGIPGQKVVIFGHAHQEYVEQRSGLVLLGAPATSVQFTPRVPMCIKDALTPGYRVLTLYGGGKVDTEVIRL